ncbi:MAG: ribonuclease HII [Campylobacterota bacterium]|nr:ribonuclease HII [Campylobacterota bacterium]
MESLCGIDEAGRGPIAGALVIAGVILNRPVEGLNDSKKLTEKKRESLFELIIKNSTYHIVSFSAQDIDEIGISKCLKAGLEEIMNMVPTDNFLFDGNSKFGVSNLQTMIKADAKIPEVSAASILAKVTRDREMIAFSKTYPEYAFEKHKGYGTALHVSKIKEHGYCDIHRRSFRLKALEDIL